VVVIVVRTPRAQREKSSCDARAQRVQKPDPFLTCKTEAHAKSDYQTCGGGNGERKDQSGNVRTRFRFKDRDDPGDGNKKSTEWAEDAKEHHGLSSKDAVASFSFAHKLGAVRPGS
jgi:hypothetical protein